MADEDNLDIDIYGADGDENADYKEEDESYDFDNEHEQGQGQVDIPVDTPTETPQPQTTDPPTSTEPTVELDNPTTQSLPQGTKRSHSHSLTSSPGSTPALMVSELHWWTTEDDIRSWACSASVKEITFSEHKVNGKSKGQAFVEFDSASAASVLKHEIEGMDDKSRRFVVAYANPSLNPLKSNPKDKVPGKEESRRGAYSDGPSRGTYQGNGFRGRGGGNQRGGGGGGAGGGYNAGNYNNNRNFSGGAAMNGGYQGGMNGGFQPNPMMTGFNGGFNRGGGMAMRGGRGGMAVGMGVSMNGMMGMNPMMGNMGIGFPGGQMFNPQMQMFGQANGWGGQGGGPNKRQRQD